MMNRTSIWLAGLIFILLLGGCQQQPTGEEPAGQESALPADVVQIDASALEKGLIELETVQRMHMPELLTVSGRIGVNENKTTTVGSFTGGRVLSVLAETGDRVRAGQLLAELQCRDIHTVRADFAKAMAALTHAESEWQFVKTSRDRVARMYELKAAALEELQRAEAELRRAEMAVVEARAEVNLVKEQLEALGVSSKGALEEYGMVNEETTEGHETHEEYEDMEQLPVNSPLDGTVLQRLISPGMVVTPADQLFIISDLRTVWVMASVPEKNLSALREGLTVNVRVRAFGDETFQGRITRIGEVLDPVTRTIPVRCELPNPEYRLKPEMYTSVTFQMGGEESILMVPVSALQEIEGIPSVFVEEAVGQYRQTPVSLGRRSGDYREIREGLSPGRRIVTKGSFLVKSELLKQFMAAD
jgi:cobalt-zinc-cadmium efflux system membrane fusion protein